MNDLNSYYRLHRFIRSWLMNNIYSLHITQLPQFTFANDFEMLMRHLRDHRQKLNSPFENYPIHVVLTLCRMRMIPMQSSEVECRQNSDPRYMTKMTECCRIPQLITAVGVLTLCTHITMPSNDNQRMRPHHSEIARESEWETRESIADMN